MSGALRCPRALLSLEINTYIRCLRDDARDATLVSVYISFLGDGSERSRDDVGVYIAEIFHKVPRTVGMMKLRCVMRDD